MKNKLMLILTVVHAVLLTVAIALIEKDIVPIHWGPSGVADNYGSKWTMLLLAFIPLAMHLTQGYYRTPGNSNVKLKTRTAVTLFLIAASWGVYTMTAANMTDIGGIFPGALAMLLGLLIMYISNSLPTVKQNHWYGIKVYWTFTDEEVWKKTHRLGAYTGMAFAVFAGIIGIGVIPTIYAAVIYKKLHPKDEQNLD